MPQAVLAPGGAHGVSPSMDEFSKLAADVAALKARVEQLEALAEGRDVPDSEPIVAATTGNDEQSQD